MFRVVIFDLNGTILDDEPVWADAFVTVLQKYGVSVSTSPHQSGIGVQQNWERLITELPQLKGLAPEQLSEETFDAYFDLLEPKTVIRTGFVEYIEWLKGSHILCALSTSSDKEVWERVVQVMPKFRNLFDVEVTGDMVSQKKPAPDLFVCTLEKLQMHSPTLNAGDCLVFEDSGAGIEAAKAAGMSVVYIPNGHEKVEEVPSNVLLTVSDFTDEQIWEIMENAKRLTAGR